ncbi:uncharacterized protein LOC118184917 isoform X1 [Stegodyphus dumicola]|uniref:uncharacterized protein LOC118184917 isoform X1 n=1 Tax=Stegodyphus dumicola TaxID=202533 RepID=UPI0015B33D12|nr:uncharacterized protein LOC118184917 isoform X1 [Stegodyphus dumicola]
MVDFLKLIKAMYSNVSIIGRTDTGTSEEVLDLSCGNMKRNNVKYIGQCLKEMSRIFEFSRRRLPEIPPRMVLPLPGHAVILGTKLTVAVVIMALIFSLFYQIIR